MLLPVLAAAQDAGSPPVETRPVQIERAQFLAGDSFLPPPDDAPWQPVTLPDNWHQSRPGASGGGWYRIELPITAVPRRIHGVSLPRDSAPVIRFFVNGRYAGATTRPDAVVRASQQPYITGLTAPMFRPGRNVLHVHVKARSDLRQGLTRVGFGDSVELRALWLQRYKLHVLLVVAVAFVVVTAGVIVLALWGRSRRDPGLLWFGLAAILAGLPTIIGFSLGTVPGGAWREAWSILHAYAWIPALALGALHMADLASRRIAFALWSLPVAGLALATVTGPAVQAVALPGLGALSLLVLAAAFVLMLARSPQHSCWLRATAAAALATATGLAAHDLAHWLGWIDYDRPLLSAFVAPVLTLALGALAISRHLGAVRELDEARATLEQRVAERTAEVVRTHAQLRALETERARSAERQRIMADLHDGLGASLVSLLSVVQGGKAGPRVIERRVHDALLELRLAVDSQDIAEGDLITSLATVRYRMRDALEAAGVDLQWHVGDLPPLDHLAPAAILDVQRIVLEALANAIRHAQAKRIEVVARVDGATAALMVADDGRGFQPDALPEGGRGLMIMRRRAARLGGRLSVDAAPGRGTRITLSVSLPA